MCFLFIFNFLLDIIIGWVPSSLIDTPKPQLTRIHAEIDISSLLMCWYLSVSERYEITNLRRLSLLLFSLLVTGAVSAARLYIFNIHIIKRLDLLYLKLLSSNGRNEPVQQKCWLVLDVFADVGMIQASDFFFFLLCLNEPPTRVFVPSNLERSEWPEVLGLRTSWVLLFGQGKWKSYLIYISTPLSLFVYLFFFYLADKAGYVALIFWKIYGL